FGDCVAPIAMVIVSVPFAPAGNSSFTVSTVAGATKDRAIAPTMTVTYRAVHSNTGRRVPLITQASTMYLENQEPEFTAFLAESTSFWRQHTGFPGGADANIYVDWAHDNPAYLLTNLWIAKYLQRLRPARLIG